MSTAVMEPITVTQQLLRQHNLTQDEYARICTILDRTPTIEELGIFSVMWSEHCSYKSSRVYLKTLPTSGEGLLCKAGEENAGVVQIDAKIAIVFKCESHNHPSAVEPHAGAATAVGGILRDIFTMGARPIALMNSLRFGSLRDARTRFLLHGVVRGIADYGNCLAADELVTIRNSKKIKTVPIGSYIESLIRDSDIDQQSRPTRRIEALSFDPVTYRPCWRQVTRIFRKASPRMLRIRTTMGRSWRLTPDHPSVVAQKGRLITKPSQQLVVGDMLPLLMKLPVTKNVSAVDLLSLFKNYSANVYVKLRKPLAANRKYLQRILRTIEHSPWNRHRYLQHRRMPLCVYLALEQAVGYDRRNVELFLPGGKSNYINSSISLNKDVARLMGYYLAEGCVSANGTTYKIIWTFGRDRANRYYVSDVCAILRKLKWRFNVEHRKSTIVITVSSWFVGVLFKKIWRCGARATEKSIPDAFFKLPKTLRIELLKGLWRGDGSITLRQSGSRVKASFASTSQTLANQVTLLLQDLGVIPLCYSGMPSGYICGRKVRAHRIYHVELNGYQAIQIVKRWFDPVTNRKIANALCAYKCSDQRYSFPRHELLGSFGLVKVTDISSEPSENFVYDFEIDGSHLFVSTGGLITHNCMGVPTVGGELVFDESYRGNPLVNAMCVGVVDPTRIARAAARGVGNPVMYVGASTGRDGLGGASFASRELTDASDADRPAVQLGDPFMEKCLLEATLEALATDAVMGIQDMGAAGLTCSTAEMPSKSGLGMDVELADVPRRETGMTPYEVLLSESQERMLLVVKKGRDRAIKAIFDKWGLQSAVIGRMTSDGMLHIKHQGKVVAHIPAKALTDDAPVYTRPAKRPANFLSRQRLDLSAISTPQDYHATAQRILTSPTVAHKAWVFEQYDHMVQTNTVVYPGADASVLRLKNSRYLLAMSMDGNGQYCALDPYEGGKLAVAESARNLVCVGAQPIAMTNCLNFGNPEHPEIMWQFQQVVAGMSAACRALNTPVTGGNVSFYNEGPAGNVDPTPVIGMIGTIKLPTGPHTLRRRTPDHQAWMTPGFKQSDDAVVLLGHGKPRLAGSEYLHVVHGRKAGRPTPVNLDEEQQLYACVLHLARQRSINAAHDCSDGGLFVTLAEMAFHSPTHRGAHVTLERLLARDKRPDIVLFGEAPSRIVVTCTPDALAQVIAAAQQHGVPCTMLGSVGGPRLQCGTWIDMDVRVLERLWRNALAMHVEGAQAHG